jgi:selenide,water dikinase
MSALNTFGKVLGGLPYVTAMTDVTGFGLLGHAMEMAIGSGLSINLNYGAVPIIPASKSYASQRVVPDATFRNWNGYQKNTVFEQGVNVMEAFQLLPDPQTNGGLLFSVNVEKAQLFEEKYKLEFPLKALYRIGDFTETGIIEVV